MCHSGKGRRKHSTGRRARLQPSRHMLFACVCVCVWVWNPQCPGGAYNEWGLVIAPRKNGTILAKEEGVVGSLGAVLTYDRR